MKRYYLSFGMMLACALAIVSCTKEIENPLENEGENNVEVEEGVPFSVFAFSDQTKTTIEGFATSWTASDAINLFHAEAATSSYVSDGAFSISSEDLSAGIFRGTLASALEGGKSYDWYAIYPYTSYAATPATRNVGSVIIGSAYDGNQTQTGNGNTSHLCATACPLYGVAKGVAASEAPSLQMHHLASILEVEVVNSTGSPLVVENISFKAPDEKIVGKFYVDITGETPVYAAKDAESSDVASLTVASGEAIANGASAKFYLAVKPFTASAGKTLSISVNGHEKQLVLEEDFSFNAGKVEKLKFTTDWDPVNDLLTKMLNLGYGSKVIRVYGETGADSKFIAHYYVDIAKSTIHFTTFDFVNKKVTRYEPTLTANSNTLTFDTPVVLPGKEYSLGSIEVSSAGVSFPDMTDLWGDYGTGTQLTDNWCWGQYDQLKTVKDYFTSEPYYWYQDANSEWKYNYYQWHFKNTKPTVSSDFTTESAHPYYGFEWNGVYQTFAANFSYEYVYELNTTAWVHYNLKYRASSPEGNLPIAGTDVLKFDSAAGMADTGLGGIVVTQDRFRSRFPNISTFLLDQYHVIVRDTEARDAGMIIMSTTSDSFIYWPQAVN